MSGERFLLDSVIVIDHLNGHRAATDFLLAAEGATISVITRAEVLTGFDARDRAPVAALLDRFRLIAIDRAIADAAADLRRTWRWRLADALQAAVALRGGLWLATRNTRDFPPKRHRFVRVPYTL